MTLGNVSSRLEIFPGEPLRAPLAGLAMLAFISTVALAQVATSEIAGQVTDKSGGVLPGVTIRATHVETGTVRETVTDERGSYVLHTARSTASSGTAS